MVHQSTDVGPVSWDLGRGVTAQGVSRRQDLGSSRTTPEGWQGWGPWGEQADHTDWPLTPRQVGADTPLSPQWG